MFIVNKFVLNICKPFDEFSIKCGFGGISEKEGLKLLAESANAEGFFSVMAKLTPLNYFYIFQVQFGTLFQRNNRDLSLVSENLDILENTLKYELIT